MADPDVTDEQNEPLDVPDHHGHTVASGYGSQPAKVPPLHGQDQNYQLRLVEDLNMYSNQKQAKQLFMNKHSLPTCLVIL